MNSVNSQTKTYGLNIYEQISPSSLLNKQRSKEGFSSIFFQLGSKFNRMNQIKLAEKLICNSICSQKNISSFRFNKLLQKNERIVNDMNSIYHKITQSYPRVNKHQACLDDIHQKYNQMVSMVQSPKGKFFSTEIKKRQLSGNYLSMNRILSSKDNDDSDVRNSNNDISCEKQMRSNNRMTIKLRGSRRQVQSNLKNCSVRLKYSNIELKESDRSVPFTSDRRSDDLKSYEMQDNIRSRKNPNFKF